MTEFREILLDGKCILSNEPPEYVIAYRALTEWKFLCVNDICEADVSHPKFFHIERYTSQQADSLLSLMSTYGNGEHKIFKKIKFSEFINATNFEHYCKTIDSVPERVAWLDEVVCQEYANQNAEKRMLAVNKAKRRMKKRGAFGLSKYDIPKR